MNRRLCFCAALAAGFIAQLAIFAPTAFAAPGDLDTTFNTTGKVVTNFGGSDVGTSVAVQSDGKIVVAGVAIGGTPDFALARYMSTGELDTSFGSGGKVTSPIGSDNDTANSVTLQSDGKIVVAGQSWNGSRWEFAVVRYTDTGALDATFGIGGKLTTPIGTGDAVGRGVAMQGDGKIVVAGYTHDGSSHDFAVVRYTSAGALDASFGSGGKVVTPIGSDNDVATSVAIQGDGKIIVAGSAFIDYDVMDDFALARYNTDGSLDGSFGSGGKLTSPVGSSVDYGNSVVLQTDGKIILAGTSYSLATNHYDFSLARFTSTGVLDTTFGNGGKMTTPIGSTDAVGSSVALQSNGKILVAGVATNTNPDFALVRYTITGALDSSFGNSGVVTTPIGSAGDSGNAVTVQSNGKIVVAGHAFIGSTNDFALARYVGDDPSAPGPTAVTEAASSLGTHTATLNGSVNPNGSATIAWFEYGTTTAYGQVTAMQSLGSGTSANPVTANLTGLPPATLYHYRLATQGGQLVYGADMTFTTLPIPEIRVFAGGDDTTPELTDGQTAVVNFGTTSPGFPITRSFTVKNVGTANLHVTGITLPAAYDLEGPALPYDIAPNASLTFQVRFLANAGVGTFSGAISLANDDEDEGPFDFPVTARAKVLIGVDNSFGSGGQVTTPIGSGDDYGRSVAVQSDGKIVMAGFTGNGGYYDFALVRYTSTGALDTSFGSGGKVTTPIGSSANASGVALQSDGKIVVAGSSYNGSNNVFALARYTITGALDTSFGSGGTVTTAIGIDAYGYSVAVQGDGNILVGGYSYNGSSDVFALARYTSTGALDTSFGTGGKVTTLIGSGSDAYSVAVQSDGKIVMAGYADSGSDDVIAVVRYTSAGALDTSFGSGGKVTTAVGSYAYGYSVVVQSDGKIVVAGYSYNGSNYDFVLGRYTSAGALDASFGSGGVMTTDFGGSDDSGQSVALQSNGKIVVAGYSYNGSATEFAVARYTSAGALDTSFGTGGKVTTPIGTENDSASSVALQSDGKIVVAGTSYNGSNNDFAVVRYNGEAIAQGPTVATGAATSLGATTATLNGTVNPNGSATTAWFEYGTTTAYGQSTTAQSQGSGTSALPVTANITGLNPATLYHFRIAAQGAQTASGDDVTFTTPSDNTNLSNLTLNSATFSPAFASGTTSYTSIVTNATTSITVTPTVAQPNATVKVNGVTVASGSASGSISLAVGQNTINTVVTAQDVTFTKTYAVVVTRLASGPQIRVFSGANDEAPELTNGQAAAVDFGSTVLGTPGARSFTVRNDGNADLHLTSLSLPAVYEHVGTFSAVTLAPTATFTFQARFLANTVHGTFGGTLSLGSDDPEDGMFQVPLTAVATGFASPGGSLDSTFGSGGKAPTNFLGSNFGASVAVQSDGKILVAGTFDDFSQLYFGLVRYTNAGVLDTSFGSGGKVSTLVGTFAIGKSVTVQTDGKILVAGYSRVIPGAWDFTLVRYTSTGALDTSFGSGGVVTTPVGSGDDFGFSVAVQSDGKIVVAGYSTNGIHYNNTTDSDIALVRYTTTGALDTSFGSGGKVITSIGGSYDYGYSVAVQSDGKIVVSGQSHNSSNFDFTLVRFTSIGALDTSFGTGGKAITPVGGGDDNAYSVTVQSDGKIVAAGYSAGDFALARYTNTGALDASFGSGGVVTTPIGSGDDSGYSVALQIDGKIVVSGSSDNGSNTDFALVRYTSTGALDTSFGSGGKATTDFGGGNDHGFSVALQSDGKIVVAGETFITGTYQFALARYEGRTYPEPTVATTSATSVTTTSATLNGTVNPNGIITSAWFEYGTTTSYGQSTPSQPRGDGTSALSVAATPTGLAPGTLYHCRIVGQNGEVIAFGADATFTTLFNSENWRLTYFGTSSNTGDAADTADPDGDGVSNLMEFATGSNPTSTSSPPGSEVLNGSYIEFTYTRSDAALADGVTFAVEWSETLAAGSWSNSGVTESILSDNGILQQVKAFVPAGSGNLRFVYLKVTSP